MHAMHTDPRRLLLAAMAAFALALGTAWLSSDLGTLSFGSSDGAAPAASPATTATGAPTWQENPLASPLVTLRTTP